MAFLSDVSFSAGLDHGLGEQEGGFCDAKPNWPLFRLTVNLVACGGHRARTPQVRALPSVPTSVKLQGFNRACLTRSKNTGMPPQHVQYPTLGDKSRIEYRGSSGGNAHTLLDQAPTLYTSNFEPTPIKLGACSTSGMILNSLFLHPDENELPDFPRVSLLSMLVARSDNSDRALA